MLFETLLGFKLPRSMANKYRNQRERAKVEIGVISPYANKRIITPILETIRSSPRFIGSLVSSFATIIADTFKYHCSYLPKLFTITNPFKFCHRILFYYCESVFQNLTHAFCIIRLLIQIRINFIASAHHTKHFLRDVAFLFLKIKKLPIALKL